MELITEYRYSLHKCEKSETLKKLCAGIPFKKSNNQTEPWYVKRFHSVYKNEQEQSEFFESRKQEAFSMVYDLQDRMQMLFEKYSDGESWS